MMRSLMIWSLVRYLALFAVLLSWRPGTQPAILQSALLIAAIGLFGSAFVWPRCPHCGARVVRFNARDWLPGFNCWQCHRPY